MKDPRQSRSIVLAALPATQRQIRATTGLSQAAVSRWLATLRENSEAHIGEFVDPNGPSRMKQAVYHAGPGPDVVCTAGVPPKIKLQKEGSFRRPGGSWEDDAALERAKMWLGMPVRRDPMVAALFGPA